MKVAAKEESMMWRYTSVSKLFASIFESPLVTTWELNATRTIS